MYAMEFIMKNNNKMYILKYMLIFLSIVISADSLIFGAVEYSVLSYTRFIFYFSMSIISIIFINIKIRSDVIIVFLVLSCIILSSSLFNNDFGLGHLVIILIYVYSMIFVSYINKNEFIEIFQNIVFVLALISLIVYLFSVSTESFISVLPKITNKVGNQFYSLFIMNVPVIHGLYRNWGLFREPGVYQMYLNISLIFMLFYKNIEVKIYRILIIILTILSTFSTTAYFVMFCILLTFFILTNNKNKIKFFWGLISAIILFVLFAALFDFDIIELVFLTKNASYASMPKTERYFSVFVNLYIGFNNLLYGAGISHTVELFQHFTKNIYFFETIHNTNHILIKFANFGIIYLIISLVGYLNFMKSLNHSTLATFFLFIALMVMFIGEEVTFSPIFNIIMFYGFLNLNLCTPIEQQLFVNGDLL